ncbi:HAMP domain-containing sensor histidine kinase [Patulibacter minatonensis]|uniref:HAMP domain-containing sensor histidine kinase n=1 Tax=Patulibacter minatonensis TaxID=298163 RepID=UPI00047EF5C9|nr:HAMP domain-containing sensor histidine kinase [Patulibacter minatonensis]
MRRLRGLRGRFALALMGVSALTLAITAALLLIPLDRALRDDAVRTLAESARASRSTVRELPPSAYRADSRRLRRVLITIRRQTAADAAVYDARAALVVSTDVDDLARSPVAGRAIAAGSTVRFERAPGDDADEAAVATPFTVEDRRYVLVMHRSLNDLPAVQHVVRQALLVAAGIALLIALVVGLVLASRLVARVTALRDTALRVSDAGMVVEVRPDDARDEIGDLTRAFAAMQQQLRDQEDARRTFVATASHELRTPLASLLLMLHATSEDLADDPPDLDEARRQVGRALGQTERLTRLSATLLDLSRLDARLPLRAEPVELGELARSIVAEFPVELGVRLHAEDDLWCTADPGSVAQVVRVLVDNAALHGAAPIVVTAGAGPGRAVLTVEDGGPGVRADEAVRIFGRFERGNEAGDSGSGLGLAIGRELAVRMGGDLRLEPGGNGARFVLELPSTDVPT